MPGLKFLAMTALFVSMNARSSVQSVLSVFTQRDALGESMNGPRRTFDEKLKAISGTLTVLIGLLALVPQFSKHISEAVDAFIKLPPIVWYLLRYSC
jgi:hypothetical protein